MLKPLLIPYAIDHNENRRITSDEIAALMADPLSTIRLRATAVRDTARRRRLPLTCPECGGAVYPHAPRSTGRHYWTHLPRGDGLRCPLEAKRPLTPDDVNALIFRGRQEGSAHRELVDLLCQLAALDPAINAATIERGVFEPPDAGMRGEGQHGRFPDVRFTLGRDRVVLEAQVATITLHGINGRRAFYDRLGIRLLWVMRQFDPTEGLRASVRDIVADQAGVLFSVDAEVAARSRETGRFLLRAWRIERSAGTWTSSLIDIAEAVRIATPQRWSDDFKARWLEAYRGRSYDRDDVPDPWGMLNELAHEIGEPPFLGYGLGDSILRLVRLLISLEAGVVAGSGDANLISLVNHFHAHAENHRAVDLIAKAILQFQPDLMLRPSVTGALNVARRLLVERGTRPWTRGSLIGRMRAVLFPDWSL